MAVTRIRIPSTWTANNGTQQGVADFQLGLGPCGKTVTGLWVDYKPHGVIVTQMTDDNEVKVFTYLNQHITGRIEETRI